LEALQNDCVPSSWVALGHAGCEHVFKVIHDLPVPFRATLPNAAVKYRLGQKELSLAGGSVGQLPHLQASSNSLKANILVDAAQCSHVRDSSMPMRFKKSFLRSGQTKHGTIQ